MRKRHMGLKMLAHNVPWVLKKVLGVFALSVLLTLVYICGVWELINETYATPDRNFEWRQRYTLITKNTSSLELENMQELERLKRFEAIKSFSVLLTVPDCSLSYDSSREVYYDKDQSRWKERKLDDDEAAGTNKTKILVLIKSAIDHLNRRISIRKTWGSHPALLIRFVLGLNATEESADIEVEQSVFNDIIKGNFYDYYYNNTYKTLTGLHWAETECGDEMRYVMLSDDDMWVNPFNLLNFTENLTENARETMLSVTGSEKLGAFIDEEKYEHRLNTSISEDEVLNKYLNESNSTYKLANFDPLTQHLYMGTYQKWAKPMRHKWSKWYVSLSEYKYAYYPPYIWAGSVLLTRNTVKTFVEQSHQVDLFIFDDIYLGILAKKAGIPAINNNLMVARRRVEPMEDQFTRIISTHGYSSNLEMLQIWNEGLFLDDSKIRILRKRKKYWKPKLSKIMAFVESDEIPDEDKYQL